MLSVRVNSVSEIFFYKHDQFSLAKAFLPVSQKSSKMSEASDVIRSNFVLHPFSNHTDTEFSQHNFSHTIVVAFKRY